MTDKPRCRQISESWAPETLLVHGGTLRSPVRRDVRGAVPHPELRLRQRRAGRGALQGRGPRLHLLAASPTRPSRMFEERMRLLEGAGSRARHRHRHGRRHLGAAVLPQGRRSHRRGARACSAPAATSSRSCVRASASPARSSTAATSRPGSAPCAPTPRRSSSRRRPTRRSTSSTSPPCREIAHAAGALVVVDNVFATPLLQKPLEARRRRRRLFRHQAHRRPGPLPRRRRAGLAEVPQGPPAQLPAPDRPVAQPVQRLGDAQGPGDAAAARARAMRERPPRSPTIWPARRASRACCSAAAPTIRRRRSPSGRCGPRPGRDLRDRGRQGRRRSAS